MEILGTTLKSITLAPHYDKKLHISSWRVDLCYHSHPSEYEETVSLSVIIPAGDRGVVAIQKEAIDRVRKIFEFAMVPK